jgi:hypothetical protein
MIAKSSSNHFKKTTDLGKPKLILLKIGVISSAAAFVTVMTPSLSIGADWRPTLAENILMLPPQHMEKAIDRDFNLSPLANEMSKIESQTVNNLSDVQSLQEVEPTYDGEENIEIRHQIIVGKKSYIEGVGEQLTLQRKKNDTKLRLYKRLLKKASRKEIKNTNQKELEFLRQEATARAKNVRKKIQEDMFLPSLEKQSKFSLAYNENLSAIDALTESIKNHPMNELGHSLGDENLSKVAYLRRIIQSIEAENTILDMEEDVLGHMAKLVALDAMQLSEDVTTLGFENENEQYAFSHSSPADSLDIFLQ